MESYSLTLDEACQFLKISRPTATNWIRTGRLQATRKDPTKPKSPYLTTRQACIAALQSPLHTVQVSAGDGITEERKCHSSAEMKYGMPRILLPGGKRIKESLGTKDKRQAQELHDKRKAELWRVEKLGIYLMSLLKRPA